MLRLTLIILATIGALVVCLAVVVGMGMLRLSSVDPLSHPLARADTQPSDDDDPDDDAASAALAANLTASLAGPELEPTRADRSIFLSAADAQLHGVKVGLFSRDNAELKRGDRAPALPPSPPPPPDVPVREGHHKPKSDHKPSQPFIAHLWDPSESAEWAFTVPRAGKYAVSIVYTCGKRGREMDTAGERLALVVAGQTLTIEVKQTTSPYAFEMGDVGTLTLPQGENRLAIRGGEKLNYGTMHIRSVRLFPID